MCKATVLLKSSLSSLDFRVDQSNECRQSNPFYADKEKILVIVNHDDEWEVNRPWNHQQNLRVYVYSRLYLNFGI